MNKRVLIHSILSGFLAVALPISAHAATDALKHPLWYKPPSAKTMELAKIADLSNTVVSDGQRGEKGVLASSLKITPEQIAKIKADRKSVV